VWRKLTMVPVVLVLVAAACSSDDDAANTTTTTAESTTTTAAPAETGTALTGAESPLGEIVVDDAGNTLYVFIPDEAGQSTCYDGCATAWPPLEGAAQANGSLDASLMGTSTRTDSAEQVTYNGWPLYYFANDAAPGGTNGQGVNDVWYVIAPSGEVIR